jgi:Domain of unknown function (DUF4412)
VSIARLAAAFFAAAFSILSAPAAFAASEGVAEFKGTVHTEKNQAIPSQGKVFLSKSAVRVEWQTDLRELAKERKAAGKTSGTPDEFRMVMIQKLSEPDRTYVINDRNRTYAVNMIEEKEKRDLPERKWKVEKLGRDTVAGFSCEKAMLTAEDGDQTEVCVTTELIPSTAWLTAWNRREEQATPLAALKRSGLNGFPVRWIFRSKRGKEVSSSVELVRFTEQSVPASLFEIPAGYRKVGSMMETMMTPEQGKQYQDALQKMQEDLDKMTPEQRKAVEELLKQQQQDKQQPDKQ